MLKIYCDGGSRGNPGPAAAAFVVHDKDFRVIAKKGIYLGRATNNVAEYSAVIQALEWANKNKLGVSVTVYLDSQLIVNQLTGKFKIREKTLQKLAAQVKKLERGAGTGITYRSVLREKNRIADFLVNQTLDRVAGL